MNNSQREQNPDVNSYQPDSDPAENPGPTNTPESGRSDIEQIKDRDVIPVPPDSAPAAPVEEPPEGQGAPVGDVDDSPKRIV